MSSKDEPTKSPTDSTSAPSVPPNFQPGEELSALPLQQANVKCTHCGTATVHLWCKVGPTIAPTAKEILDFLELARMQKRLLMCTNCGNMRLTT